ncbi:MAG: LysE family translocator [Bacteroidetes bacterium]|nr:LysE family translocator [Bacteroidota bacterium]
MEITIFLKGILIGLFVSLPVGPISVLGVRRILLRGPLFGMMTGFGAATADAVYCFIAAFGLTFIADLLIRFNFEFNVFGGIFLLLFGLKIFFSKMPQQVVVSDETPATGSRGLKRTFLTSFIIAFTNPIMILSFLGIFAALGINAISGSLWHVLILVAGVFGGAAGFWFLFSQLINKVRTRFTLESLHRVNMISGLVLGLFGIGLILVVVLE